jgi:hypothetical protein
MIKVLSTGILHCSEPYIVVCMKCFVTGLGEGRPTRSRWGLSLQFLKRVYS